MTDSDRRQHGLEPFLHDASQGDASVHIRIQSGLDHINLRGNAEDQRFTEDVEKVLGQKLPVTPNTATVGAHRIYWLGPNEWLILSEVQALAEALQKSLSRTHAAVNDLSGGQIALRLAGPDVRDVLAKGCTLDFHPQVFMTGMCAQSGLARASVLIGLPDEQDVFDIVVRRSFSDYLVRWLQHAAAEFGDPVMSNVYP